MSFILESDIIYNILPHVDIPSIGKLLCVNKFVNKLCSDKHFWKEKVKNDYKNMILKSDEWLWEYKCIYVAYVRAIYFVDNYIESVIKDNQYCGGVSYNTAITPSAMEMINLDYFSLIQEFALLKPGSKTGVGILKLHTNVQMAYLEFVIYHDNVLEGTIELHFYYDEFKECMANFYYYYNDLNIRYNNMGKIIHCEQKK